MRFEKLGNYIHLVDNRNKDLKYDTVLGINIQKKFMPSVANLANTDLSKYKIISKGQFAYSSMQVGRDETIRFALFNGDEPVVISPAYQVIEVSDLTQILPEYIMMWFQRSESDRYGWFISDGSVRASLDYNRLCEIEIPIIPIEEQKKYVSIYNSLLKNQACYENSLDDLQLICDSYIDNLIKTEEPKRLGDYIEKTELKNTDNAIKDVMGMSTLKQFRVPNSRVDINKLHNYRIVNKNEFAYVPTTDTWRCLAVALSGHNYPIVVSPIYVTFKIKNDSDLLPEYLYLFLKRKEMDRYARFHSWGSARETFNWDDMCNVMLPIPDIEKQQAIVTIYHTLATRKKLNEKLKESLQPLCPILMKGVRDKVEKEGRN